MVLQSCYFICGFSVNVRSKRERWLCPGAQCSPSYQLPLSSSLWGPSLSLPVLGQLMETAQKSHSPQAFSVPIPNTCILVPAFCQQEGHPLPGKTSPKGPVTASGCSPCLEAHREAQDSGFTATMSCRTLQGQPLNVLLVLWQWGKSWRSP